MPYRNIIIESPAALSVKHNQLIIKTDREHHAAIEDISALLIENRQTSITTAALSRLGQCGCAVFVCDEKHMPCAVLEPFSQHSRQLSVIKSQLDMSEPLRKQIWKSIVMSKIRNQAFCLEYFGKEAEANHLKMLAERVRSGDTENTEAVAAAKYFPALFGDGFTRNADDGRNAALNYGYAILRGCMARYVAVYGFLPALGLHHCSTLNAFNLADDMMEPFRPLADIIVNMNCTADTDLTSQIKHNLFNCLNLDILSGGQHHSVSYAMERMVQSLSRSCSKGCNELIPPELCEPKQHQYE